MEDMREAKERKHEKYKVYERTGQEIPVGFVCTEISAFIPSPVVQWFEDDNTSPSCEPASLRKPGQGEHLYVQTRPW